MSEPDRTEPRNLTIVRHEEQLNVEKVPTHAGSVRARKLVDAHHVEELVTRDIEDADLERVPAAEDDSGRIETLPDGSVSIPLFEEQLVITKRVVVRERVIVRKRTITEHHRVEAEIGRERIEIDADPGIQVDGA